MKKLESFKMMELVDASSITGGCGRRRRRRSYYGCGGSYSYYSYYGCGYTPPSCDPDPEPEPEPEEEVLS